MTGQTPLPSAIQRYLSPSKICGMAGRARVIEWGDGVSRVGAMRTIDGVDGEYLTPLS